MRSEQYQVIPPPTAPITLTMPLLAWGKGYIKKGAGRSRRPMGNYRDCEKQKPRCGWTFAPRFPETKPTGKPASTILSEKTLHYYDV
jgi:hypothetical protein